MTEYLIAFNDEWVPDHTVEELREKLLRSFGPNGERNYKDIAVALRSISDAHSELYDSERFWLKEAAAVLDGLDATHDESTKEK